MQKEEQNTPISETQVNPQKVTQSVTQIPEPTKQKLRLIIDLLVLVLLILGITGYLVYQNYQLKQEIVQKQPTSTSLPEVTKQPETPNAIPNEELTTNWKTYSNTKYNFTFKYPNGWKYQENYSKTQKTIDYLQITLAKSEYFNPIPKGNPMIIITVTETTDRDKLSVYQNTEVIETTTVGGVTAEERRHKTPTVDSKYITFFKNNNAYDLESRMHNQNEEHQEIFNQIVLSFKFISDEGTQQNEPLKLAKKYLDAYINQNWKTTKELCHDHQFDEKLAESYELVDYEIIDSSIDSNPNYYHVYISLTNKNGEIKTTATPGGQPLELLMIKTESGEWKALTWYFFP